MLHLTKDDAGFSISRVDLTTVAVVPEIDEVTFMEHANGAKANCPVSRALASLL